MDGMTGDPLFYFGFSEDPAMIAHLKYHGFLTVGYFLNGLYVLDVIDFNLYTHPGNEHVFDIFTCTFPDNVGF